MLKSKKIKRLTERVEALEKRLNSLFPPISDVKSDKNSNLSYEEVITEWLCGKEAVAK